MSFNTHDFRIHAAVVELLGRMRVSTDDAEQLVATVLGRSQSQSQSQDVSLSSPSTAFAPGSPPRSPSPSHHSHSASSASAYDIAVKIADRAPDSETRLAIMEKYRHLRGQQIHELPAFLDFLEQVQRDPDIAKLIMPKTDADNDRTKSSLTTAAAAREALRGRTTGASARGRPQHQDMSQLPASKFRLAHSKTTENIKDFGSIGSPIATKGSIGMLTRTSAAGGLSGMGSSTPGKSDKAKIFSKTRSLSTNNLADLARGMESTSLASIPGTPSTSAYDGTTIVNTPSRGRASSISRSSKRSSSRVHVEDRLKKLQPPLSCRLGPKPENKDALPVKPIGSFPLSEQESFILEDLLYILLGIDGTYIQKYESKDSSVFDSSDSGYLAFEFKIDNTLDLSLCELIKRILPMASHHQIINHFIETHSRFEYGKVSHALAASMRGMIKEYQILIAQLEHQIHFAPGFGLQKLWFHVMPTLHTMSVLASLITAIRNAECVGRDESDSTLGKSVIHEFHATSRGGGVLLAVIADRMLSMSGDPVAKSIHAHLLEKAAIPYFKILRMWINNGEISDPCDEFMVQERRGMNKDQLKQDFNDVYWEQRYTLRHDAIPGFLIPFAEKILLAGKYLNVVRECGSQVPEIDERVVRDQDQIIDNVAAFGDAVRLVEGGKFVADVELAYRYANQTLLDLLFNENNLIQRLRSLKHYFLLDQSDFLTHFLDLACPELLKPRADVSVDTLRSLLELVLRNPSSVSYSDPYKEDITVELSSYSLVEQLIKVTSVVGLDYRSMLNSSTDTQKVPGASGHSEFGGLAGSPSGTGLRGIDSMMLGYTSGFPVSLVLNKRVLTKFQLLFRHLFHCKYFERLLCLAWLDQFKTRRPGSHRRLIKKAAVSRRGSASSLHSSRSSVAQTPNDAFFIVKQEDIQPDSPQETAFVTRMSILRGRMLHFVQQFMHFLCYEVIDPNWEKLEKQLAKVTTVEEVMRQHNDFLDTCLKDCLLTNQKLLKLFGKLMTVCIQFATFAENYALFKQGGQSGIIREVDLYGQVSERFVDSSILELFKSFDTGSKAELGLKKLEGDQIASMRSFINGLQSAVTGASSDSACLQNLVMRVDFNLFYSRNAVAGFAATDLSVFGK